MLGVDRFLRTRGHFRRPVLIFMETFSQTELCLVKTVFLALPGGRFSVKRTRQKEEEKLDGVSGR